MATEPACRTCRGGGLVPRARCACPEGHAHVCVPRPCPDCSGTGRAEVAYRFRMARESYGLGYLDGHDAGYRLGARILSEEWPRVVAPVLANRPDHADLEQRRFHVCCQTCRRTGHHDGCTRCEDRTRATFALPHPDDLIPEVNP